MIIYFYVGSNIDLKCVNVACSDWMKETSFAYPAGVTDVIILSMCSRHVTHTIAEKVNENIIVYTINTLQGYTHI